MFSGIIESTALLKKQICEQGICTIFLEKPQEFDDIKIGDSIAVNGCCLTVEAYDSETIRFVLGQETLKITGWNSSLPEVFNLERSLRLNDRIHGHLVSGHVDGVARVEKCDFGADILALEIRIPEEYLKFVWKKGSLCLNGVSLTINEIVGNRLSFFLIPETIRKTIFKFLKSGDVLNFEVDMLSKIILRQKELGDEFHSRAY